MKILFSENKEVNYSVSSDIPNFMTAIEEYMLRYPEEIKKVENLVGYENIVLVGTGGNAIYLEPLQRFFTKNTIILDATHPEIVSKVKALDPAKTLIVYMSRSGDTLEVISSFLLFKEYPALVLASKGMLKELAEKKGVPVIGIRTDVAGRFMLATNVVGIPCYLCGLDFQKVLEAALEQKERILPDDTENDALQIAKFLYSKYEEGKDKIWFGAYSPELENITFLFNQLINEGAGKEGKGPISFLRSVPRGQHELVQRVMGGANDIVSVLFTRDYPCENLISVPDELKINDLVSDLQGISPGEIVNCEAQGTIEGLNEKGRSFVQIHVPDVNVSTISRLFVLLQGVAYYFCLLEGVDPFSNPDVDIGKEKAREIIKNLH
ncbi:hypothetical protein JXM83_04780 [Candidatus Woesearchaeota archaeon]|nr:hypothetical protein [Candidatus Woesearchaeota archaeon]